MRRLRYSVATSLDGYIAGPKGEYDWIFLDPGFDFASFFQQFDTMLIGRRTYETMLERGQSPSSMGMRAVVVSTTLVPGQHDGVTVVRDHLPDAVAELKAQPGKDIWLCGGAQLLRHLLDLNLVDGVELTVLPILLGSGLNLIDAGRRCALHLESSQPMPSGTLLLSYSVMKA